MKCDSFSSSFPHRYMKIRTLIVAHCEVRSVGIALCYDMSAGNPPSAFEGVLAYGCMTTFFRFLADLCRVCGGEVMK